MNPCECGCGELVNNRFKNGHASIQARPDFGGALPFKIDGTYCRAIPLTQGLLTIVDADNYDFASGFRWVAHRDTRTGRFYVRCNGLILHRLLCPTVGEQIDHINGNSLDNRRANLRAATRPQNQMNSGPRRGRKLKGVYRSTSHKWQAMIQVNRKLMYLGCFETRGEAALAYNAAALKHYGEFAYLNPMEDLEALMEQA